MPHATVKTADLAKALKVDFDPQNLKIIETAIQKKLKVKKVKVSVEGGGKLVKIECDDLQGDDIKKVLK